MTDLGGPVLVGIVLAAGRSERAGFPKALASLDGETFVARAARLLREGGCRDVVVVVAPPHDALIEPALREVVVAKNPAPERGMLSSLQVGLTRALALAPALDGVVFLPVDLPLLRASTVATLVAGFAQTRAPLLRPAWAGRGGHPVVLARDTAIRVTSSRAASTRDALAEVGAFAEIALDDPGMLRDLDTRDELLAVGARPPDD